MRWQAAIFCTTDSNSEGTAENEELGQTANTSEDVGVSALPKRLEASRSKDLIASIDEGIVLDSLEYAG